MPTPRLYVSVVAQDSHRGKVRLVRSSPAHIPNQSPDCAVDAARRVARAAAKRVSCETTP